LEKNGEELEEESEEEESEDVDMYLLFKLHKDLSNIQNHLNQIVSLYEDYDDTEPETNFPMFIYGIISQKELLVALQKDDRVRCLLREVEDLVDKYTEGWNSLAKKMVSFGYSKKEVEEFYYFSEDCRYEYIELCKCYDLESFTWPILDVGLIYTRPRAIADWDETPTSRAIADWDETPTSRAIDDWD
jgi:hypothetical protein